MLGIFHLTLARTFATNCRVTFADLVQIVEWKKSRI